MNGSDADNGGGGATDSGTDGEPSSGEGVLKHRYPTVRASTPLARSPHTSANPSSNRPWRRRPRRRRLRPMRRSKGPTARRARTASPRSSSLSAPDRTRGATVDVAREIADATDAWLELFHVVPSDAALADGSAGADRSDAENDIETTESGDGERDDYATAGERLLDAARDRLGGFDRVDRWLVEDRSAAGAIVEQSPTTTSWSSAPPRPAPSADSCSAPRPTPWSTTPRFPWSSSRRTAQLHSTRSRTFSRSAPVFSPVLAACYQFLIRRQRYTDVHTCTLQRETLHRCTQ